MNKILISALVVLAIGAGVSGTAAAGKYTVLHNFCSQKKCGDGSEPVAAAISDGAGNWYGTTQASGANDGGTVYRLSKTGKKWTNTTLYSFCSQKNCTDGSDPEAGLIMDANGNLYGLANSGGKEHTGAVFELSPSGGNWTYRVLYSFCTKTNCTDGSTPTSGKLTYQGALSGTPYDGKSPLFGVTDSGGANGDGVLFSLTPKKGNWTEDIVYAFCAKTSCADGAAPFGTPLIDASGNIFGTVPSGGVHNRGAIYELERAGKGWKYGLLYSFCADESACADGANPVAGLFQDGAGSFYGTTENGGVNPSPSNQGGGTVFKLVPNGTHSKFTKLHDFCAETNCTDGANPHGSVTMDSSGCLIGTTISGGDTNNGVLFQLSGKKLTTFTKLLTFNRPDTPGIAPLDPPVIDSTGSMFGTTAGGGANNGGVFYEYTP